MNEETRGYFEAGRRRAEAGDHDGALTAWEQAIALEPGEPLLRLTRGLLALSIGQMETARIDYEALVPESAAWRVFRTRLEADRKAPRALLPEYDQAVADGPNEATIYYYRAMLYYKMGESARAIEDYSRAIDLDPTDASAYLNRGNIRLEVGEIEAAIADFDAAITINRDFAFAFNSRANAYRELGDHAAALSDYDRAIDLMPGYATAYHNRGYTREELGDLEGALADLTEYLSQTQGAALRGQAHVERMTRALRRRIKRSR